MENRISLKDFPKRCCIVGCEGRYLARGLCHYHYHIWNGEGATREYQRLWFTRPNEIKVFIKANSRIDAKGCWLWTAHKNEHGYGIKAVEGEQYLVHRLSAHVFSGFDINSALCICHKCDTPACVNPEHLEPGTAKDNMRHMVERNRRTWKKGSEVPNAKLVEDDILIIRERIKRGHTHKAIASDYGVDATTISAISMGRQWAHVK